MVEQSRREQEKETKRRLILKAGVKLFGDMGFNGASMDKIALEAQLTKRTLYKYFPNKVDLFFAIALKSFEKSLGYINKSENCNLTVYEQLLNGCKIQYKKALENPRYTRISSEVGYVRRLKAISPHRDKWYKVDDLLFKKLVELFDKGVKEGSLRSDLDPQKAAFSYGFLSASVIQKLLDNGETFANHFNLDESEFANYSIELLLSGFKSISSLRE